MTLYSVEQQQDRCASCKSGVLERVPGADHRLCKHPRVLRAFSRERVAAALAYADECLGRLRVEIVGRAA